MRYKKLLAVLTVMGMLAGELAGNPCTALAEPVETAETGAAYEEELPYGLQGMDSDYTANKEELALKEDIASHDIAGETEKLTEGVDYRENEVYFFADDEAYALEVAAAYNAVLVSFQDGVAVIRLDPSVISVAAMSSRAFMLRLSFPSFIAVTLTFTLSPTLRTEDG